MQQNAQTDAGTVKKVTEGHKIRVRCEPALEEQAAPLNARQRRALARVYRRWSRQLFVSAWIMERDAKEKPPEKPKPLCQAKLKRN